ncbi:MAG: tetraacyldisaccharide 4'-kinase [Bdellovibrionales bacterium]|nr:tetraacyldisaccharide 4'-kinase [Bdellovibrionales bacterium]
MLYFLSLLFKFIVFIKNYLYDNSYLKIKNLPLPVISIGNLSAGGAGKTPLADYLIKYLLSNKKKPAILSRGYGRKSKGIKILNNKTSRPATFFGDEAFMLYSKHNIDCVVGVSRYKSAKYLLSKKTVDYFILDDGLQHRQLFRDLNIVLLDASKNKDFYKMLPLGRLREDFTSLKRADIILFTKVNLISQDKLVEFKKYVNSKFCIDNVLTCDLDYCLSDFVSDKNTEINKSMPVVLLSGIANPQVFKKNILDKNILVKKHFVYSDHFVYTKSKINDILYYCKNNNITQIICTEKDWHKLKEFYELKDFLFYAKLKINFLNNEDLFLNKLLSLGSQSQTINTIKTGPTSDKGASLNKADF